MKRFSIFFALCFMIGSILIADEMKPPVPLPPGDSTDLLPPPMDLNQMTPLPEPAKQDSSAIPAPPVEKNDQTDAALTALDEPKSAAPIATPVKAVVKKKMAAPAPAVKAHSAPPEEKSEASAPAPSMGAFADYFPAAKGAKWTYEYLKAEAGSKTKKTRTVECVSQEAANGGVNATLQVTEDGQAAQEKYSLHDNQVEHTATGDQAYTGDFTYKFPSAAGAAWSVTEPNGTIHKSKSSMGKAQVYKKTYPDCVIVIEKIVKGGKAANTVFYYYAKGIGLVATEVYSPKMKLIQTSSLALVSGPGDVSK